MIGPTYIGRKRGTNHGLVMNEAGVILGRVFKHSRVAAGTGGQRRPFYTANVCMPDGSTVGESLGTRHKTRRSATRAIRLFWEWAGLPKGYRGHFEPGGRNPWRCPIRRSVSQLASSFKRERWKDCALPYPPPKS